jgi:hypothetical protein
VIPLGLRLTLKGGREAVVRLVVTAVAVTLGVTMLLMALAGINAVNAQNGRYAWLNAAFAPHTPATSDTPAVDPLWWKLGPDYFDGHTIGRVDLAATGATSPVPPGIDRLPGPGEFEASPAMSKLLREVPSAELRARYSGRQIGTIGPAALPAPDSLIIIVGHRADQLSRVIGAERVTSFRNVSPGDCNCYSIGINANGLDLTLSVVALAVLFPVLIFVGAASRLSAARREQRFAAMRLVGATPRQVSVISAVESTVAAVAGVAAGFGLFFVLRPAFAQIPFTGARFYPGDLSLGWADIVLVAIGVPVAAAVAARVALRRVQISPLGVGRRTTPKAPSALRLVPLLAGIGELAAFVAIGRPSTTAGQIKAYLPGFVLIIAGLVVAGPWLTMVGSRIMARRTNRPAVLIAGRRLSDNPQAAFRAISGLVVALFVASVAIGMITSIDYNNGVQRSDAAARATLVDQFFRFVGPAQPLPSVAPVSSAVLTKLTSIPGVQAVTMIHRNPLDTTITLGDGPVPAGVVSCAALARTPALGRCLPGASAASIVPDIADLPSSETRRLWPTATISPDRVRDAPIVALAVRTDGSSSAIERARTVLQVAYPDAGAPATIAENNAQRRVLSNQYQQLVDVVILTSLPIAGCSLAVSVAAGLNDRKRPFSLLRLSGASLGILRRVVALESAVPLLIGAVVATAAGFLATQLFVTSQLHYSLRPPGVGYYIVVLAGLAASLGVIASTLPLLARITGPETARNE